MNIDKKIEQLFKKYKKEISIQELTKMLKLQREEIDYLLEKLYELEKNGIIIYDEITKKYKIKSENSIYEIGTIIKGKSNNLYIKQKGGYIVKFKNDKNLEPGDIIYYTKEKTEHPKRYDGTVKRKVTKIKLNNNNYITKGVLKSDGNHFYVKVNDKIIYIDKDSLKGAFTGDTINISVKNNTGYVLEILNKYRQSHSFKAINKEGNLYWIPIAGSYGYFTLPNNNFKEGDIILANPNNYNLELVRKIETSDNDLKATVKALINEYGFYEEFPKEVMNQINKIKNFDKIEYQKRKDLRNLTTITIDPKDAKDLDDAISLEYADDKYIIYVSFPDPSYYIPFNSPIFKEALKRGFSIYPLNDVLPMLERKLSSDLCSLNEEGDKLSLTLKLELNKKGTIESLDVFKSIIKNKKQMNYDDANEFYINGKNEEYKPFSNMLHKAKELSDILEEKKKERGAISFNIEKESFIYDDYDLPIGITENKIDIFQKVIENIMLLANEVLTVYAYNLGLPYYYRNHEKLTLQKKYDLKNSLKEKGYILDKINNIDSPRILQQYVAKITNGKSKEEKNIIYQTILKHMPRAYYKGTNKGHYGLAMDCYGTISSAARKFTNLVNLMIIVDFLDNGYTEKQEQFRELIEITSEYITEKEKAADLLERDINNLMLNYYASKQINKEVDAQIIHISQNEIYIKDENKLTGIIPIHRSFTIRNNKLIYKNIEYKKGETIKVKLINTNDKELIYRITETKSKELVKKRKKGS